MTTLKIATLTLAAACCTFVGNAIAQTTGTTTAAATTTTTVVTGKTIADRKENQQDRISQGLKSGELTAGEASKVEKQEVGINKEEAGMRAQDNGKLTTADKTVLNSQLNTESKEIYADKHNSAVQPTAKGEVNARLENQQDRISAGVAANDLTAKQTARLETQEAGIHKEEVGMRTQDNGKLTAADKKVLNKQLNQESRRINRDERRTMKH